MSPLKIVYFAHDLDEHALNGGVNDWLIGSDEVLAQLGIVLFVGTDESARLHQERLLLIRGCPIRRRLVEGAGLLNLWRAAQVGHRGETTGKLDG